MTVPRPRGTRVARAWASLVSVSATAFVARITDAALRAPARPRDFATCGVVPREAVVWAGRFSREGIDHASAGCERTRWPAAVGVAFAQAATLEPVLRRFHVTSG